MMKIEFVSMFIEPSCFLLSEYEARHPEKVWHRHVPWQKAWDELLGTALHNRGADISQVGTTWLGSLTSMQAIRPFQQHELARMGGAAAFLESAWSGRDVPGDTAVYAIPWILDTRLIVYRKDIFQKLNLDGAKAFGTPQELLKTLKKLQQSGVEIPWAMSTADDQIHTMAPWIWAAGGSFRTADDHLNLTAPQTLKGLVSYYNLHPYILPEARGLNYREAYQLFAQGRAAAAYITNTYLMELTRQTALPQENIGVALSPGIPFVGGSCLVVWKHTPHEQNAVDLIRHLTSPRIQINLFQQTGELPVRSEVFQTEIFQEHPFFSVAAQSVQKGKTFRTSRMWASIEARLTPTFNQLWNECFENPEADLTRTITQRLTELSARIERVLLTA